MWLLLESGQLRVEACPTRCTCHPDVRLWGDRRRIVEGPKPNHGESKPSCIVCEQVAAALGTEAPSHMVPALSHARVLSGFAFNLYGFGGEDCVCSPVASDVLTVSTPAKPGDERLALQTKANLAAEATSRAFFHWTSPSCASASEARSCGLTFELSGRRRQATRPGLARLYRVPPDRAWWPAVGAPLERGVRPHSTPERLRYAQARLILFFDAAQSRR